MRTPIDPKLRHIGEKLQKVREETVQKPMPWRFLDLLCQLDEKEEAVGPNVADMTPDHPDYEAAARKAEK